MANEIIKIIEETLGVKGVTENTNLINDLEVESLDLVDLISAFEEKYNIEIPDSDIKTFQTVKDIINYIENV